MIPSNLVMDCHALKFAFPLFQGNTGTFKNAAFRRFKKSKPDEEQRYVGV